MKNRPGVASGPVFATRVLYLFVYFFFLGAAFFVGAAAHGVTFKFSILAFSVSMVRTNGSFVKAEGTPSHWTSTPASGLPVRAASSLSATSAWVASESATSSSLLRQAGLP